MTSKLKSVFLCIVVVVLVASVCLTACAGPTTPPEGKQPLRIVMFGDMTGPLSPMIGAVGLMFKDYFSWVNENGGINGYPVEAVVIDTKYDVSVCRSAYKKEKDAGMLLGFTGGASMVFMAVSQFAAEDKIPFVLDCLLSEGLYPPGWFSSLYVPTDDRVCGLADWFLKDWKESRKPRLALLMGDYGAGKAPSGAKWYLEKQGIDVVMEEIVPLNVTDTTDHLTRVRDANPDFIYDTLLVHQQKLALKDRVRLGMQDIPWYTFIVNYAGLSAMVRPEEYDGYVVLAETADSWQQDIPSVRFIDELWVKGGHPGEHAPNYAPAAHNMLAVDAIERALDKVGGENINGQAIYDALTQTKNFTADGLLLNPASFSKEKTRGSDYIQLVQLNKDGSPTIIAKNVPCPWNLKLRAEAGK